MDALRRSPNSSPPLPREASPGWKDRPPARIALDETDLRILSVLQRNGRITKTELAEQVHLSASACFERMRRLEKNKVILSYHANVNLRALVHSQAFLLR